MAKLAGTVADSIVERVYATGGIAHTQAWVITVLSKCQRVANAYLRKVRSSAVLSVLSKKLVYKLQDDLPSAIDVTQVIASRTGVDEALSHVDISEFSAYDQDWFRYVTATRHEAWTQIGRDLLVIYPGMAAAENVTVHYSKLTTALSAAGDAFELADEDVHIASDLAEIVLLARDKQITVATEKINQLAEYLGLELADDQS
jgi:hypothetical protein